MKLFFIFFFSKPLFLLPIFAVALSATAAADTLTASQSIRDGQTLVSAGRTFEIGFFSPGSSKNRYLGIWYKRLTPQTVVWVANRQTPLPDSSGRLNLTSEGILILLNRTQQIIWSSNSTNRPARNRVAQLLDSGNLVIRDESDQNSEINSVWQSFEHPADTLLPGMKLGENRVTGQRWFLSSWTSLDDPAPGDFRLEVEYPARFKQLLLTQNGAPRSRSGPWNGMGFSGLSGMKVNPFLTFDFVLDEEETFFRYQLINSSFISRLVMNESGLMQRYFWDERTSEWVLYLTVAIDNCFRYAACGPFGRCQVNNFQNCVCLAGFQPKSARDRDMGDWGTGCVRRTALGCGNGDGFMKVTGAKLPDSLDYWYDERIELEECRVRCLRNCSCRAYANPDITGRTGCLLWFSDLYDIRDSADNSQEFYVRLAASDIETSDGSASNKSGRRKLVLIISFSVAGTGALLVGLLSVLYLRRMRRMRRMTRKPQTQNDENMARNIESDHATEKENLDLPLFDLATIEIATDCFSLQNVLGEGGFGPVYKGLLKDGQEIAVKRLARSSTQGLDEFKNEVMHIAKLQHRNLVRLLGCCIEGSEKMLVYEYLPNKSLDFFIFGQAKYIMLDWPTRFHIIGGIARGLLYLHQDSRLRIIHRDLKASNVLLDNEMNPKISDFGMARSFLGNENEANTKRVVGTYGYMSPEYAIDGLYSTKSDVFSFGVLVLEIVNGKRNRGFIHPDHNLNLLGHAWRLYAEGRSLELIDASLVASCNSVQVQRIIHLGLLCVQRHPEDRPSMSYVVQMLGGDGALPLPKQPGFFTERDLDGATSSSSKNGPHSANEMTITLLEAR